MERRTIMRLLVLSIVGMLAVGLASAPPASADCSGPSMTFIPRDADRGGKVTVTGKGWGDNCYDTGPPPDGEGVLGEPLTDIEIIVVQGAREWPVASVDADDDYGFVSQVVVPQDVAPGDALLLARKPGTLPIVSNPDPTLRISAAPAVTSPPATDSASNPSAPESDTTTPKSEQRSQESEPVTLWLPAAAVAAALAAGVWLVIGRLRST